jgi:hypothetical protein
MTISSTRLDQELHSGDAISLAAERTESLLRRQYMECCRRMHAISDRTTQVERLILAYLTAGDK